MDAKENSFYIAIILVVIVLGVLLGIFLFFTLRQQRKNLLLYKQNILAEITAQEKERSRIASDLHDEIGPRLSSMKMTLNSFSLNEEIDQQRLEKVNQNIDDMVQRLREISYDLMPSRLLHHGLISALKQYIFHLTTPGLLIDFQAEEENLSLTEQKSINLFRIFQEIIHNTVKHANASKLTISLKKEDNLLNFEAKDNGCGFNIAQQKDSSHGLGLKNLVRRVELLGGELYIDSKSGEGSHYSFQIPL